MLARMDAKTKEMAQAMLEQLRIERVAADLSYVEIARRLDLGEQTIRRYFKGEREIPMPVVIGLTEAFGLDLGVLWTRAAARIA